MNSTTLLLMSFLSEIMYYTKILFEITMFSNSNFEFIQTNSYRETTNTKVVDIYDVYNFVFDEFFVSNDLCF
jgi:hypothetical protein